ncbi:MAG TPA: hypothetical protein VH120_01480, partial [Gemmataceae bacterium]|nr:hypothetical protein [Gemmataceae bacterium]
MRFIRRLNWRETDRRASRCVQTPRLRLHRLEDRSLPSFGFGSAFGVGGAGDDRGSSIVRDAAGSVYVAGSYNSTVDFDPNGTNPTSNHVLTATDVNGDGYVAKYLIDGTFQWATDTGPGFALELAAQGNSVYVPYFSSSQAQPGGYVSRLDAGTGAVTWTTTITSNSDGNADAVAVSPSGGVYVDGRSHNGTGQAIVDQLDPATGNVLWTRTTSGGNAGAWRLAVDPIGNAYATGFDYGSVTFGSTTLTTSGQFIWKLNASGGSVWAGNLMSSGGMDIWGVTTDGSGNAYLTGGWATGANNFNPGSGKAVSLTNHGGVDDIFIEKLIPGNNEAMQLGWAKDIGGSGFDLGNAVAVDSSGYVYTTGGFNGTVNFNP